MKHIIMIFLTAVLLTQVAGNELDNLYQTFPLKGQTWLFGSGNNLHVYNMIGNSAPTRLVMVSFPDGPGGDFVLWWANFTGLNFKSVSHLINEAVAQFQRNRIALPYDVWHTSTDTIITIEQRNAPDTLWSCDSIFANTKSLYPAWRAFRYIPVGFGGGGDSAKTWNNVNGANRGSWAWFRERPVAWAEMQFDRINKTRFVHEVDYDSAYQFQKGFGPPVRYYKTLSLDGGFVDYCEGEPEKGSCYEYIDCNTYAVSPIRYWQIHLFPVAKWFPREPSTGHPIVNDTFAMDFREAKKRRQNSIDNYNKSGVKDTVFFGTDTIVRSSTIWRSPYFSDSASTVVSAQFLADSGVVPVNRDRFMTSITKLAKDGELPFDNFHLDRVPNRIIRVEGGWTGVRQSVERAILRLYAETEVDDSLYKTITYRCGSSWYFADIEVAEKYRFPDVTVPGSPGVDYTKVGGTKSAMVVDSVYVEKRYIYNGCPCLPIPELDNFTLSDMRGFVYRSPPLCDIEGMVKGLLILRVVYNLGRYSGTSRLGGFTDINDYKMLLRRIVQLGNESEKRLEFHQKLVSRYPTRWRIKLQQAAVFCPKSWDELFTGTPYKVNDAVGLYKSSLRRFVDRVRHELDALDSNFQSDTKRLFYPTLN
jgi:hypothetical protein